MAGPSASVLLPESLTPQGRAALRGLIDEVSCHDLDRPPALDAFWVRDTRPVGGGYRGGGRPFAFSFGLQPDWEPGDLSRVAAAFGFEPADEVLVAAFSNGDEDHRILGELCARLADLFGGVVNFCGALWPPVPPEVLAIDLLDLDWRQVDPYFHRMVEDMPGQVIGLTYEPWAGREWVVHVGDVAFLRAWLGHPQFRMVK